MPDVVRWLRRDQAQQQRRGGKAQADQQKGAPAMSMSADAATPAADAATPAADTGRTAAAAAPTTTPPPPPLRTDTPSPELDAAVLRGDEPFALDEPCVFRVGNLGADAYWEWVHRPVPGAPRFFRRGWVEACSKTCWWLIPTIWVPVALVLALAGSRHLNCNVSAYPSQDCALPVEWSVRGVLAQALSAARDYGPQALSWQLCGVAFWQALEYAIHRGLFHGRFPGYAGRTFHFLFHGCHHKYPMDGLRLVFPPVPAAPVMLTIFSGMVAALGIPRACSFASGTLLGYICYDCFHYACHHGDSFVPGMPVLGPLRARHAQHHYHGEHDVGFGITTLFFDVVFSTLGAPVVDRGDKAAGWLARRLMGTAATSGGGGGGNGGHAKAV
jgi:dihydroceramide fatty acyl 2-hydroxylase